MKGPIILMYHGTTAQKPESEYSIHVDKFSAHLNYFYKHNWHTALVNELSTPEKLPEKTIILTFDDGYADNFEGAFLPILEHNMKATWFITTDCIGKYAHWMGDKREETKMLNVEHLREMSAHGMEIASHTCSHPDLSTLSHREQLQELISSKNTLEDLLQEKITSFAYPYGKYNENSIEAVKQSNYDYACTVRPGWFKSESNPLLIRRVTIFDTDTLSTLARKLVFADNNVAWSKIADYYFKRIKMKFSNR